MVLCFQHIQMLSDLNWIQKSFFHDSFPPKCGVLQFKFYWNYHSKQALFFHLFLFHKPEAFFHANRCHELSHMPIQLDALLIMKNSAVACSLKLLLCNSQSNQKNLIRHHHHQVPFFRRIIMLFNDCYKRISNFLTNEDFLKESPNMCSKHGIRAIAWTHFS